jgi:transcriptional antiterminator RfaH
MNGGMAETLRTTATGGGHAAEQWYACYTRARHEKRVDAQLRERGVESFLPLIPRARQWQDRKKVVELPLFPSYVFGRFGLVDVERVLSVPGVMALVGSRGRPAAIPAEDVDNVRRFASGLQGGATEADPCPFFSGGEWVEVEDGPLKGTRGVVVQHRSRRRVMIGLPAIGLGVAVDIDVRVLRAIPAP